MITDETQEKSEYHEILLPAREGKHKKGKKKISHRDIQKRRQVKRQAKKAAQRKNKK